jgi:hypothetical protein
LFCVRIQARRWSPSLAQASSAPAAPAPSVVPGPASGTGRSALRRSPPPLLREERRSPPSDLPLPCSFSEERPAKKREAGDLETNPPELAHAVRSSHNEALCATAREFARRERNQAMSSSDPLRVGVGGSLGNFGWNPGLVRSPPALPLLPTPFSLSLFPPSPPEGREGEKCESERGRRAGIARRKRRNLAPYHLPRVPQRRPLTGNLPRRTRTLGEEGGPPLRPPQPKGTRQGSASPAPFRTSEPESPPPPPSQPTHPLLPPLGGGERFAGA